MSKMMTRDRGQGTTGAMQPSARPRSLFEALMRSPFPEFSVARDLMGAMMPGAGEMGTFVPSVELSEKNGDYIIDVALPGFKRDDIEIEVSGNELTVTGKYERRETDQKTHYSEMQQGSFVRTMTLPQEIDADKVIASFENGILRITAPRIAPVSAKKVAITGRA